MATSKNKLSEKKQKKESKKLYAEILGGLVESLTGKPGRSILDILLDNSNVNEFIIAKKLGLTINQTRNILYKLSDNGIVSFNRKKDKKKGWYTYFWTLDILKTLEFSESRILESIKNLSSQKKNRESKRFYICKICNIEVSEETALLNSFTCIECGSVYEMNENKELIVDIDSKINQFNNELLRIRESLDFERKKVGKKIEGKNKREKEKKRLARVEKKKESDKAKKKLVKPNKTSKVKKKKK